MATERTDARFLEVLLLELASPPWSAWTVISIGSHQFDGAKLGHLLNQVCPLNRGRRAIVDVIGLFHLLVHCLADGRTVIVIVCYFLWVHQSLHVHELRAKKR